MKNIFLLFMLIIGTVSSCIPVEEDEIVEGMAPLYSSVDDFSHIESIAPIPVENLGKIVTVDNYIFINELYKGIHVVDNTDPTNPDYIHFWRIYGCTEFTIEGKTLYADNTQHLIVIDISDFENIQYVKHIDDFYDEFFPGEYRPPNYSGRFTCVDPSLGIVIDWELKTLTNPLCTAF